MRILRSVVIPVLACALLAAGLPACAPKAKLAEPPEAAPAQPEARRPFSLPAPEAKRPSPQTPHAEPLRIEGAEGEKYIILNFENTDIKTIITTFGELLGINYILTPGISGSVTVQSYKKFPVSDIFPIFQTLLEINGLTAVKDGEFYKIIPIDTAKQQPLEVDRGKEFDLRLDASFITQLVPLENVKAADTANILRALMPRGTDLIVYEPANMLIVTAQPATLSKFMKILEALDVSEAESEAIRTFVYYVEHGKADKLAEILKAVYGGEGGARAAKAPSTTAATPATTRTATAASTTRPRAATTSANVELPGAIGDITITSYEDINALIVKCNPRTYLSLLEVLRKIDVPPRQVLIEVMIASHSLSDSSDVGVEWIVKSERGDTYGFSTSTVEDPPVITTTHPGLEDSGIFASVISGIIDGNQYSAVIKALESSTSTKVLASPSILATDNQEAEIKIGKEIPTATSTTQSEEGTTTSSQIQYKTVGTILTITPHITEKGNVSMKIAVEKSDTGTSTTLGSGTYPDFTTNKASTTAVVQDGHTLVLAGMIEESIKEERNAIPLLSKIPVLGYLFGNTGETRDRSELIVMVTPRVIMDQESADAASQGFAERIHVIKESFSLWDKERQAEKDAEAAEAAETASPEKDVPAPAPVKPDKPANIEAQPQAPAPAPPAPLAPEEEKKPEPLRPVLP